MVKHIKYIKGMKLVSWNGACGEAEANGFTLYYLQFTGDVIMWAWERNLKEQNQFRFLKLEHGAPTIYSRFMANVYANHAHDTIMPIVASSIVGMKLLERLLSEGRLHSRPDVLFLDSAHEADETFMELQHAWSLLRTGGVLFGDDWSWSSVANDVIRFANGTVWIILTLKS